MLIKRKYWNNLKNCYSLLFISKLLDVYFNHDFNKFVFFPYNKHYLKLQ